MRRMSQKNRNCGRFKRRLIALSLLLCCVVVSLLAAIFIVFHADHDCIVKHCFACVQIRNAQELAVAILIAAVSLFTAIITRTKLYFFKGYLSTLVSVKVRMNN